MGNKQEKLMTERVETAKKTGVFVMSGAKCIEIPVRVMELASNVRTMDLSNNQLTNIPTTFGNFTNLKQLNLDKNNIEIVPQELCKMKKLEVLQLGHNKIMEIPTSFSKFANLKTLNLQSNYLTVFPLCLCELKSIDAVDLSQNQIEELPEYMQTFQAMELNMNQNKLKGLPKSLVSCPRLKVLRLEENVLELRAITSDFLRGSKVAVLAVDGNLFQMKDLYDQDGYEQYMSRYTATKKKYI